MKEPLPTLWMGTRLHRMACSPQTACAGSNNKQPNSLASGILGLQRHTTTLNRKDLLNYTEIATYEFMYIRVSLTISVDHNNNTNSQGSPYKGGLAHNRATQEIRAKQQLQGTFGGKAGCRLGQE